MTENKNQTSFKRREKIFCHHLLLFFEQKFKNTTFHDDFKGKSKADFFFENNDYLYMVEAKSDFETQKDPGLSENPSDTRKKIAESNINSNLKKWMHFFAQLNEYIEKRSTALPDDESIKKYKNCCNLHKIYAVLGLPLVNLCECINAIKQAEQLISRSEYGGKKEGYHLPCTSCHDDNLQVSYICIIATELKNIC